MSDNPVEPIRQAETSYVPHDKGKIKPNRQIIGVIVVVMIAIAGVIVLGILSQHLTPLPFLSGPTPTPRCINETWAYADNVTTQIKITPALKITLEDFWEGMIQIQDAGTPSWGTTTNRVTIHGDGRVVFDGEVHSSDINTPNHYEKQISADQLRQIIAVFEEANFYAISRGCKLGNIMDANGGYTSISIETEDKTVTLKDGGTCDSGSYSFSNFCEISAQVNAILNR